MRRQDSNSGELWNTDPIRIINETLDVELDAVGLAEVPTIMGSDGGNPPPSGPDNNAFMPSTARLGFRSRSLCRQLKRISSAALAAGIWTADAATSACSLCLSIVGRYLR